MKRILTILALMSAVAFQMNAQTYDWSDLIGKKLVLSRWGRFVDGIFLDYRFTNPAGEKPVEQLMLTDSTHFEWKYALTGDFSYHCLLKGNVMECEPPFWENRHINIIKSVGNVILTKGDDGLTRCFFIHDPQPTPEALPASCISEKGFCDGKLDDLLTSFTDFTYNSQSPMGRHFLFCLTVDNEMKKWLESTDEAFISIRGVVKPLEVNLYPNGKPVLADVNQKLMEDCNFVSVMAEMAFQYPEFIKSIIHQESPESFRVDMFDPMGNPIVVRVSNRFLLMKDGSPIMSVGKDDQPNWITILEKAAAKWIKIYQHIDYLKGCNAEHVTPMFTGDGRSFCVQPGRLSCQDLTRVINTCLEHGMMVNGGFLKEDIPLDGQDTIAKHGYTFLPPQKDGACYSVRNPYGKGEDNGILNIMPDNKDIPPLIDLRIISPGAAAKYFGK
jgi:hypothetical protein